MIIGGIVSAGLIYLLFRAIHKDCVNGMKNYNPFDDIND